jgi:hypothetical protein
MLCVYIPNIFLAMKYILYSKLGFIHKKMNEFIHITCNAGPASLILSRIFLGLLCITFVFKSAPNGYSITIAA